MLFNTIDFLWFFLFVVVIYFALPHRFRWMFLLAANYYFYMQWNAKYAILILLSTIIDYTAAIWMERVEERNVKRRILMLSLLGNLGMLFVFKYYNFAVGTINIVNQWVWDLPQLPYHQFLLPVGISFYTFQTLSYTLDVYMGKRKPEKHFGLFALYVSFFPQLVAGPIERSTRLLPQFHQVKKFRWENVHPGMHQILVGLIKKVVIADRLAILVNTVYGDIAGHTGAELAVATLAYGFQIYCDFSGYSDIAIGTARILDFDLMTNFNRPYLARSVGEFWHRWHISLSTWFRDYVYIPLGGSKGSELKSVTNLLIVFAISGVWHGAAYNFIIWGLLNGLYLLIERYWLGGIYKRLEERYLESWTISVLQTGITFTLIWFSWIFFRSPTLKEAFEIIETIVTKFSFLRLSTLGLGKPDLIVGLVSVVLLMVIELFKEMKIEVISVLRDPYVAKVFIFYLMVFTLILFGVYGDYDANQFIYFVF